MIYTVEDNLAEFQAHRDRGERIRHIDVGSATSLYSFIASAPYTDEYYAVDLMPANIGRLQAIVEGEPVGDHWQAWLEVRAVSAVVSQESGTTEKLYCTKEEVPTIAGKVTQLIFSRKQTPTNVYVSAQRV